MPAKNPSRLAALLLLLPTLAFAQSTAPRDPSYPKPETTPLAPRLTSTITRSSVDKKLLREVIHELVLCGSRSTLSSWSDPARGAGCARDRIVALFNTIAQSSSGKLQVVVDKFESTSDRTSSKPLPLENVYAILPGTDPALTKTAFIVSGHFDSRASDVMDPSLDSPGADDDASGVAVSIECARLLAKSSFRSTIIFAAVSGEEQGLLGSTHMLDWAKAQGYTVGGMLDNDIVGADQFGPHRVRLFSGFGEIDDADSPSRELARAIEEIAGRSAVRLIFRVDRYGRGGDHYPFYKAGLPAVRFTEPLENYDHQHQTVRTENGTQFGDLEKYLNFDFIADVARDNAESLRQLALAPAPPVDPHLTGAVTPDAKISFSAPDDPDRAGFEILLRETTASRWSAYSFVTKPGEVVLHGLSTDNLFFAVRSIGKNRARSIAIPTTPAPRS